MCSALVGAMLCTACTTWQQLWTFHSPAHACHPLPPLLQCNCGFGQPHPPGHLLQPQQGSGCGWPALPDPRRPRELRRAGEVAVKWIPRAGLDRCRCFMEWDTSATAAAGMRPHCMPACTPIAPTLTHPLCFCPRPPAPAAVPSPAAHPTLWQGPVPPDLLWLCACVGQQGGPERRPHGRRQASTSHCTF